MKADGTSNQSGCYITFSIVEPFQTNTSRQSPMSSMARGGTCGGLVAGSVGASVVGSPLS